MSHNEFKKQFLASHGTKEWRILTNMICRKYGQIQRDMSIIRKAI